LQKDVHWKVFDVSYLIFPPKILHFLPGKYVLRNETAKLSQAKKQINYLKTIFTPLLINMSGIAPPSTSWWVYNCRVTIDKPLGWTVKELFVRNNYIKYLDVDVLCTVYKLTSLLHVDLSDNGLEMVHPTMCLPNLEHGKCFSQVNRR
jgi:hypothetical protein